MRGWSFPSNQGEEWEEENLAFTSGVSLSTLLVQMNQSLAFFEEQLQLEIDYLKFQPKSLQDQNLSEISDQEMNMSNISDSDQEMVMWDLSSSMSGMMAWTGTESLLKSDSLIAMTSILNNSGGSCNHRREEKLISNTTTKSPSLLAPQTMLAAGVGHPVAQDLELASAGRVHHTEVNGDDVVLEEEEKVKWPRHQIRGRAMLALFWLLNKMSKSKNQQL